MRKKGPNGAKGRWVRVERGLGYSARVGLHRLQNVRPVFVAAVVAGTCDRLKQCIRRSQIWVVRDTRNAGDVLHVRVHDSIYGKQTVAYAIRTVRATHTLDTQPDRLDMALLFRADHLLNSLNMAIVVQAGSPELRKLSLSYSLFSAVKSANRPAFLAGTLAYSHGATDRHSSANQPN